MNPFRYIRFPKVATRALAALFAVAVFAGVSMFTGMPGQAHAAATGLTIQPVKISELIKSGASKSGQILLTNASSDAVQVDISVEDFVPTSGTETFQFVGRAPGVTSVRDWITIQSPLRFTFKPGESKEIPYTITAPADAEPGSHFGVIFFKATRVADLNAEINVGTQVGTLVFVTIPGTFQQSGTIQNFGSPFFLQGGPVPFSLRFDNTGTVYFEPKGTIDIYNMFGSQIASVPIGGYAVLPTGVKDMAFSWNVSGFLLGRYKAVASVYASDGSLLASKDTSFYVVPIWWIVGFIVILALLYYAIRFVRTKLNITISVK
jgi:hypothetical protein